MTLTQSHDTYIGNIQASYAGLGGWTLSDHHIFDPRTQTVYRGDGGQQKVAAAYSELATALGTGFAAVSPDGTLATRADVKLLPTQFTIDANGSIIFIEHAGSSGFFEFNAIRKVEPSGALRTIATLGSMLGVAMGPDGKPYVCSSGGQLGTVDLNTGAHAAFASGVGQARLAFGPDGSLFAQDRSTLYRYKDGQLQVFATGFNNAYDVAIHPDGNVYVADSGNRRIVRIATDGTRLTVAGGGPVDTSGAPLSDGIIAVGTDLKFPTSVAIGPDKLVYFASNGGRTIYRITRAGTLERIAGTGVDARSPDGTPASRANISPWTIEFGPNGFLHVMEVNSARITRIRTAAPLGTPSSRVVPSEDGSELYTFDSSGRHLYTTNPYTGVKTRSFVYDGRGQIASVTDANGRATHVERNAEGVATAIVAPDGQRTELHVASDGYLGDLVQPGGGTYSFSYDGGGLLIIEV